MTGTDILPVPPTHTGRVVTDGATLRRTALQLIAEVGIVTEEAVNLHGLPRLWRAAASLLTAIEDGRPSRIEAAIVRYGDAAAEVF